MRQFLMGKGRGRPDPFGVYREWTEQRLNPGHYLGGNLPPELRRSYLGPRGRRHSGILLGCGGAVSLLAAMALTRPDAQQAGATPWFFTVLEFALPVLSIAAGVSLYRSARDPQSKRRRDRPRRRGV